MQPIFPVLERSWVAECRNAIQGLWVKLAYHGSHRRNSLSLYIGHDSLMDCEDIELLEGYLTYLEDKHDKKGERI